MKKIKKFLIVPLVALFFGLLPHFNVFASDDVSVLLNPNYTSEENINNFIDLAVRAESEYPIVKSEILTFVNSLFTNDRPIEFVSVDTFNKSIIYHYLTLEDVAGSTFYTHYKNLSSEEYLMYSARYERYSLSTLSYVGSGTSSGSYRVGDSSYTFKFNRLDYSSLGYQDYNPNLPSVERPSIMPDNGNGIFISSPSDGVKINKLTKNDKGYYEQHFKVRVRYKPNNKGFVSSSSERDKSIIFSSTNGSYSDGDGDGIIIHDSFKWITTPEKALDSVNSPYAECEFLYTTVFQNLGKKVFNISMQLNVLEGSEDFSTFDYREYTDSINIEFVCDENYKDNVIINPDGSSDNDNTGIVGGDDFPTAPEGGSILDWITYLGQLIMWIVTYPFKLLAEISSILIGYISTLVSTLTETSVAITSLFTFIPQDILNVTYGIISFTLMYSVVRGVIKLIRG